MATVATQSIDTDGLAAAYSAASPGGDKYVPGENTFLHIKNGSVSSIVATLVTPGTKDGTLAIADRAITVPAGEDRFVAAPTDLYRNPADGFADITWSATTTVTFAVVRS